MPCLVIKPDGTYKEVTNLGWILRHWEEVERIDVVKAIVSEKYYDCVVVFYLKDKSLYVSEFASSSILLGWLDRPIFRGRPLRWFGAETCCGGLKHMYSGFDYSWDNSQYEEVTEYAKGVVSRSPL